MQINESRSKAILYGCIVALLVLLAACGTAATPTPNPTATTAPQPTETAASQETATTPPQTAAPAQTAETPTPTASPQPASPSAERPVSAKDRAIAVIGQDPGHLFIMQPTDAHTGQLLDTVYAYIGHLDKQALELAPTSQVVSWEQTAPDEWIFNLRPGVTYHNGDAWNAEAFKVYAQFAGDPASGVGAYAHTGPYTVEVVDELTARVKCGAPCPIFARAMNVAQSHAPSELLEKNLQEIRIGIGVGPYQIDDRVIGQKVVTSKFEDFVPVPENPEYAAPVLNEIEWQWRSETTVRAAMVEAGEADWAFLLTLEDADQLGPERFVTGGTAEIAQFLIDTVFDPWLSQLKMRQAIVHSINCPPT